MSLLLHLSGILLILPLVKCQVGIQAQCLDSTPLNVSPREVHSESLDPPAPKQPCICVQEVAQGLYNPLILEAIPDGSGRLMVGQQTGQLYVYSEGWVKNPTPFMNVSDVLLMNFGQYDERGLLGLAFHPGYECNGKFYIYFSTKSSSGATEFSNVLVEFSVNTADPNRANLTSGRLLIEIEQPAMNHNGGTLLFGIDGYLYIFTGDGGNQGDPDNRGQNRTNLYASALRIDVDSPVSGSLPYVIPPDNPFVDLPGFRPEIYVYGLRNPWRCSMDQGDPTTGYGRGRIFCGDVGQSLYEEIDIIQAGKNYGWSLREGFECYKPPVNCGGLLPDEVLPIFAYNHSVGISVIGGYVYRGSDNPSLQGAYIMGDWGNGRLIKLVEDKASPTGWKDTELHTCGPDVCNNGLTDTYGPNIVSFGTDHRGELYILAMEKDFDENPNGKIYQIVEPNWENHVLLAQVVNVPNLSPVQWEVPLSANREPRPAIEYYGKGRQPQGPIVLVCRFISRLSLQSNRVVENEPKILGLSPPGP